MDNKIYLDINDLLKSFKFGKLLPQLKIGDNGRFFGGKIQNYYFFLFF